MKKNVWKQMRIFALAGIMSLALMGCGGSDDTKDGKPVQNEEQDTSEPEENDTSKAQGEEPADEKGPAKEADEEKKAENISPQSDERPTGEIIEIGNGQFTIKKFIRERLEDGGEVMAMPAEGESMEDFESLIVSYDESTHIYKRTIRDGGASYEDEESSFEKLEKGVEVEVKGSYQGDVFQASEIQIVEVIL